MNKIMHIAVYFTKLKFSDKLENPHFVDQKQSMYQKLIQIMSESAFKIMDGGYLQQTMVATGVRNRWTKNTIKQIQPKVLATPVELEWKPFNLILF